jgi:RNA recognition motif-containing protein
MAAYLLPIYPGKALMIEVQVSVRNLSKSTTQQQLNSLFEQAGDVSVVRIIKDRRTGLSQGFAFVTMSAQSEADKAVSMFNWYILDDHFLKVELVRPREQRGLHRNY